MKLSSLPRLLLSFALAANLSMRAIAAEEKPDAGPVPSAEETKAYAELSKHGVSAEQVAANINWRYVNFRGAPKADASVFALLDPCTLIVDLDLSGASVSDADLAHLAGLKNLRRLSLANSAVTDSALGHLKGLGKLETINLFHTAITDAGLAKLHGLKALKQLYVFESKVTDAGAGAIKGAIPGVKVDQGWKLPPPEAKAATPPPAAAPPKPEEKKAAPAPAPKPPEAKPEEKKPAAPANPAPKAEEKKPAPEPPKL